MTNKNPTKADWDYPYDPLGAFCHDNHVSLDPTGTGALDNLTFAVKDVMDIAGSTTGFGQPVWFKTHEPASESAVVIDQLLNAGARLVGRTIADELSYSLTGENVHYGTPLNPVDPARIPGGSSSGSVSAVAGELVDFSLGTDCAGSVRLPASYCGVYGIRPTHSNVEARGVIPFAPSFDTVGWFARDPNILEKVGSVILRECEATEPNRLIVVPDAFALVEPAICKALQSSMERLCQRFPVSTEIAVSLDGLKPWMECFRTIQGAEIWKSLGPWITAESPVLGPGIDERIAAARGITESQVTTARAAHKQFVDRLKKIMTPGDVLCLPTSPRVAPLKGTDTNTIEDIYRYQAMCLLSIAGLGGLPQISLPMAKLDNLPLGISLIGLANTDIQLLKFAAKLANNCQE